MAQSLTLRDPGSERSTLLKDDCRNDDVTDICLEDATVERYPGSCNNTDVAQLFYGTHETQVSEGGEADLHKHFHSCTKNRDHKEFVPVGSFTINHLPDGHHDNDLVELIKATADLTVKVDVQMTSLERPEFWPGTEIPYSFYDRRGSDVMRVGTGTVRSVTKFTEEDNKGSCPCRKCQHSDEPSKVWGEVKMYTATHVVFDDVEARNTTCRLFYDRQDSPLVILNGWTMVSADIEDDWCELKCSTCDLDLLDKLDRMAVHWLELWKQKNVKHKNSVDAANLSFMVSHPHGCAKHVSVGQWNRRCFVKEGRSKYTYTTCTCPGSSGAYVYSLVHKNGWQHYVRHEHCGVNTEGSNYSGAGSDME